ncbi:hypothetical protein CANMA_002674 [Candida margitis]|uniref:uncharacterized protein n=1 Tax=Candida margitis TaxID=1775924 RepID=UPI0022280B3F|nr:uncharacterized protein CANMA_002674 [Candida margitis]KAI5967906.1 hypothetical protein CANMA_002674 [Candida margitis]
MTTFSTGRGGAGNIHHFKDKPSEENTTTHSDNTSNNLSQTISGDKSNNKKPVYYSTGRGGAGNMKKSDQLPSPKLVPQGSNTPHLTTSKITTGRGGYGNMIDNNDPELTRKLQDVEPEDIDKVKSHELQAINSRGFSVGRGGFGNVISNSRSRSSSEHENGIPNLYSVSSHGEKKHKKKKGGFMEKIKEIFA